MGNLYEWQQQAKRGMACGYVHGLDGGGPLGHIIFISDLGHISRQGGQNVGAPFDCWICSELRNLWWNKADISTSEIGWVVAAYCGGHIRGMQSCSLV